MDDNDIKNSVLLDEKSNNIKEDGNLEKKSQKGKKFLYILIIILIGCIIFLLTNKTEELSRLERDINALQGLLPGKTIEEIQRLLNESVEEGMVNISINPEPEFENGKAEGYIAIENIPGNHYALQVNITLSDTGEVVFQSGLIDPGYYIKYITLDKELSKGDYPAMATFTAYYIDNEEDFDEVIGRVSAEITLHILN